MSLAPEAFNKQDRTWAKAAAGALLMVTSKMLVALAVLCAAKETGIESFGAVVRNHAKPFDPAN